MIDDHDSPESCEMVVVVVVAVITEVPVMWMSCNHKSQITKYNRAKWQVLGVVHAYFPTKLPVP